MKKLKVWGKHHIKMLHFEGCFRTLRSTIWTGTNFSNSLEVLVYLGADVWFTLCRLETSQRQNLKNSWAGGLKVLVCDSLYDFNGKSPWVSTKTQPLHLSTWLSDLTNRLPKEN